MVQQVRLVMFSLSMVDYSMSLISLWVVVDWTGLGLGLGGFRTKGLGTGLDNILCS